MDANPKSWLDRAVGACLSVLIGAAAVYIAVRLVEAVWTALLVIGGVLIVVAVAVAVLRYRRDGW